MAPEAKITIARTSEEDVKQRQVIVKLDGKWIGSLTFGKTLTKAVEPGRYTIQVDNTWQKKSIDVTIAPGEDARFRIVNRVGRFTWMLVAALGAGPMYVSIEREEAPPLQQVS